jgi:hypothetical protein
VGPEAEVEALLSKGKLQRDTHSSSEEGMLDFDVAAGENTFLAHAYHDCVGMD